ncbi:AAA family ATPase [Selenihalanaerobacter shriftii]|uniref:Nuclease SbcCD subunit C n=1 Tax=Selenihalanaerobacter shriftii TaxID=142842 RepID=A0A1T4NFE3_9FIRM|nr:AAA family ATPase [Selenihalanaerobacter shriftii]SJZ77823.1 DNA sulfur modification protein DndD [Selenihalanaerobacter shriftii]
MLLKSLSLKNFRQYKGKQEISFSNSNEKNVIVILGKNTSGKTTLIQAFNWILYGKANFETSNFLLNLEIANDMRPGDNEIVIGELELIHNDIEYKIVRKQEYSCSSNNNVTPKQAELVVHHKLPNGQRRFVKDNEQKNTINKILPEDLADYFFFDGERIGNLAKNNRYGRKDIANAVKSVLGLNVLDTAITHLSRGKKTSVIGKLKNSIDTTGDDKLERKKRSLDQVQEEYEKILEENDNYDETIDYYNSEIEKKEEIIKEYKPTSDLKKEMKNNEREIDIKKKKKVKEMKRLVKDFSKNAPMFFMQPLLYKAIETLEGHEVIDEGIPEMHAKSIDFLIKRGECICGTKIAEESEAYNHLIKQKNYLPPQSIGTMVRVFMNNAKHYQNTADNFFESFKEKYIRIREYKNDISSLESRNDNISNEIDGKPDVGKYEREVRELKRKLVKRIEDKEAKIKKQGNLENEIERLNKDIAELASASEKNKFILDCIEYTEYLINILSTHYGSMERNIKRRLQKKVNEIFSEMYHGKRKIIIDDRYEYDLTTPDIADDLQSMADESKGLETVTSFAFISGIVALAKEKLEKELDDVNSEAYPLVMDAPFSNADEHHVANVSKVLPEVAEQVIMFIMHKDWKYAEDVLGPKLEKLYELDKKTETHTIVKEESNV